uniref:uncharacterized protein LOC124058136 n=1 Tax=Scatophagus argus TaxID=75038 RepID=UPI001ED7CC2C|nr:uncharacterized protein LOC124058136 [Scatophagus argus]
MSKPSRKKHISLSPFRRTQKAANNRRLCIIWINRMVKKQVEKQMGELRSEFLLMFQDLREEMAAVLQEIRELVAEKARERALHRAKVDQQWMTLRWLTTMEDEYKKKTGEDEQDEAQSLNLGSLSFTFSEKSLDSSSSSMTKTSKCEVEDHLKILSDVSNHTDTNDGDTSGGNTSDVCNDAETSSQPAKHQQRKNRRIPTDVANVASQQKKESEEGESSRSSFHGDHSFMNGECGEKAQLDRTKEEEDLVMERQWIEWMDKQEVSEKKVNIKVKPIDQLNTEKQEEAAAPASKGEKKEQNPKGVGTVKKMKTYISGLFNPHSSDKWVRLEEED